MWHSDTEVNDYSNLIPQIPFLYNIFHTVRYDVFLGDDGYQKVTYVQKVDIWPKSSAVQQYTAITYRNDLLQETHWKQQYDYMKKKYFGHICCAFEMTVSDDGT